MREKELRREGQDHHGIDQEVKISTTAEGDQAGPHNLAIEGLQESVMTGANQHLEEGVIEIEGRDPRKEEAIKAREMTIKV